jgi:hypothetical protein
MLKTTYLYITVHTIKGFFWRAALNAFLDKRWARTKVSRFFSVIGSCGTRNSNPSSVHLDRDDRLQAKVMLKF